MRAGGATSPSRERVRERERETERERKCGGCLNDLEIVGEVCIRARACGDAADVDDGRLRFGDCWCRGGSAYVIMRSDVWNKLI